MNFYANILTGEIRGYNELQNWDLPDVWNIELIFFYTSNIHSDTATFISVGAQDFISVGTITPTFTARLSCDGNAGVFGYIGIKSVIN